MLVALLNRSTLQVNVLADRNPPYVLLSDGDIRNGYTVKILNKLHEPREFTLSVGGLPQARFAIVGMRADAPIRVTTDDLREVRVFVTVPAAALAQLDEREHAVRAGRARRRVRTRDGAHDALPAAGRSIDDIREEPMSPTVLPQRADGMVCKGVTRSACSWGSSRRSS